MINTKNIENIEIILEEEIFLAKDFFRLFYVGGVWCYNPIIQVIANIVTFPSEL